MNRGLTSLYLVPWTKKKNPGNQTSNRHSFSHDEAVDAQRLSAFSKGAKGSSRSLEAAFGMVIVKKPRRPGKTLTYQGQTLTIGQWAKIKGMSYECLRLRILHGWPLDLALETPVRAINSLGERRLK